MKEQYFIQFTKPGKCYIYTTIENYWKNKELLDELEKINWYIKAVKFSNIETEEIKEYKNIFTEAEIRRKNKKTKRIHNTECTIEYMIEELKKDNI